MSIALDKSLFLINLSDVCVLLILIKYLAESNNV